MPPQLFQSEEKHLKTFVLVFLQLTHCTEANNTLDANTKRPLRFYYTLFAFLFFLAVLLSEKCQDLSHITYNSHLKDGGKTSVS